MKIITLFTIQDYLQDTIDKVNIWNFIKIQIMYNTKAFSLKIVPPPKKKKKKTLDARSGDIYFAV